MAGVPLPLKKTGAGGWIEPGNAPADEVKLVGFLEVFADVDEVAHDLRLSGGVRGGLGGTGVRPNVNADDGNAE